jgi:hypothetical protein
MWTLMSGVLLVKYVPISDVLLLLPWGFADKPSFVELPDCSLAVGNPESAGFSQISLARH